MQHLKLSCHSTEPHDVSSFSFDTNDVHFLFILLAGLFFHVVGEGVVNLSKKAENFTDKENYIDFRLRLLGEPGNGKYKIFFFTCILIKSYFSNESINLIFRLVLVILRTFLRPK